MQRFYVPSGELSGSPFRLPDRVADQVRRVLRLRPGDEVAVFDGSGAEWTATLQGVNRDGVTAVLGERRTPEVEPAVEITLLQALVKADRFELVLQKATELGVGRFEPFISERVLGADAAAPSETRMDRWRRIVIEAAEQSGRVRVPDIESPDRLHACVVAAVQRGPVIMLWEESRGVSLRTALRRVAEAGSPAHLSLVIGPAGGFHVDEVIAAESAGAVIAGMGPRVLRTETAAIAALTAAMYELGQMGG